MLRLLRCKRLHRFLPNLRCPITAATPPAPPLLLQHASPRSFSRSSSIAANDPSLTVAFLTNSCGLSAAAAAEKVQLKTTERPLSVLALLKDYGLSDADITRLLARRPQLLVASPDRTLKPKLEIYRKLGLAAADLGKVLDAGPGLLLTVSFLRDSCGLSVAAAVSAADKIKLKTTERPLSVLALLKNYGFSDTDITRLIARRPQLLVAIPDKTLKPKLEFYHRLGLTGADLGKVLAASPRLLLSSLKDRLLPNLRLLKPILKTDENIVVAVKNSPLLLLSDLRKLLLPKMEALQSYGVPEPVMVTLLTAHPRALIENSIHFDEAFGAIKDMGISPSNLTFAYALGVLGRLRKPVWERKLANFRSFGFSEKEVLLAFARHPYCMSASEEKIRRNVEFLAAELNWSTEYMATNPVVLSLSLEKRVRPRRLVWGILQSKGLVKGGLRARHLLIGEKEFLERYVIRYLEEAPQVVEVMKGGLEKESPEMIQTIL